VTFGFLGHLCLQFAKNGVSFDVWQIVLHAGENLMLFLRILLTFHGNLHFSQDTRFGGLRFLLQFRKLGLNLFMEFSVLVFYLLLKLNVLVHWYIIHFTNIPLKSLNNTLPFWVGCRRQVTVDQDHTVIAVLFSAFETVNLVAEAEESITFSI